MTTPLAKGATTALILLAVINLINFYDRMLVVVVSQPLRLEFGLSDTQYGALTGPAFVFVYAASSLVFGVLADRFDRRKVIAGALAAWSAMTALCGFASSFALLALGRAGVGIGEAGSNPAGLSLLADHYPPARRPMAVALFNAGGMIGLALSFVVGSWISGRYGWRAVFLFAGLPGLILALLSFFLLKSPPRGQFERNVVAAPRYGQALRILAANPAYMWMIVAAAFGTFSSLGMLIWLPQFFIRTHGMATREVGLFFGPAAALGLCGGMVVGGWIGNRFARRSLASPMLICIVANFVTIPLYATVLWTGSVTLALVATFAAMLIAVVYTPAYQASMQTVCPPAIRSTGAAVANVMAAVIGQGLLPFSIGVLSDALRPSVGTEALRWSLTAALSFAMISGLLFVRALAAARTHFAEPA